MEPSLVATTKRTQVRELLEELMATQLGPGDPLPSERRLVERFGVSRVTVRNAIADLVASGRLERVHGKGTFITGPQIDTRLHLMSFSREMRARGLDPQTKVLRAEEVPVSAELAPQLHLQVGDPIIRVERLRLADGAPMALEVGCYPSAMFPQLLQRELNSLYDVFAKHYNVWVTSGQQTVSAESADARHAAVLGVARRAPLLVQERVTWAGEQVMEVATSAYRADRYRIQMDLTLTGAG